MNGQPACTQVLAFDDEAAPAAALAGALGVPFALIERHRFPDGELCLRLPGRLDGSVVLWRGLQQPNDKLVELMLAAPTARELGAARLLLVCPYLAYMRQDIAFRAGEAVSQRQVGRFLAGCCDALVTVDPHLHRTGTLAEVLPGRLAIALSAAPLLGAHAVRLRPDPLLLGPDAESAPWVARAAAAGAAASGRGGALAYGVCTKRRLGDRDVRVELPPRLALRGRAVVLIDDVASTGHTLAELARRCIAQGAASVDVAVTHALLDAPARALLADAGVGELWSTDTVAHPSNAVSVVPLIAQALSQCPRP